jgi:O-antigen ligase
LNSAVAIPRVAAEHTLVRGISVLAVTLFCAAVPLLASNNLKVTGTLVSALLLVVGTYAAARTRERIGSTVIDLPAAAFLLVATLATVFSVSPFRSFFPSPARGEGLLVYIAYIAMALAAARLAAQEISVLFAALLTAGALIGAMAVGQYYGVDATPWFGSDISFSRSWGTLGNPDFLGGYASLLLPLAVALAVRSPGRGWGGYGTAAALLYASLVCSETRSAWAGAVVAGAVLLLALRPAGARTHRRLAILGIVFVAITATLILTRPQVSLEHRALSALDLADEPLQQRLYVWERTIPLIVQKPLLGWGFSALLGRLPGMGSAEYVRIFGYHLVLIDTPHNETLHIAYSTGLLGLAVYLWAWIATVRALWRVARSPRPAVSPHAAWPAARAAAAGILAGLVGYFIWLQFAWSHIGPANVFWVLAGIAAALHRSAPPAEPES